MPECRVNQDQRACRAALWVQTPTQHKYIDYQSRWVVTAMRPPVLLRWVMDGLFVCLPGRQRWDGTWWWEGESLNTETNSPQRRNVVLNLKWSLRGLESFWTNLSEQSERKHSLVPHYQHWGAREQGTRLCLFQWPTDQAVIVLGSFQVCLNVIMTDNEGTAVRETLRSEYKKHVNSSLPVQLIELRHSEKKSQETHKVSHCRVTEKCDSSQLVQIPQPQ